MNGNLRKILLMLLGAVLFWGFGQSGVTYAAVFGASAEGHSPITEGVLDRDISVCFVGSAVTSRPDRVQQIVTYIREFEYAANIRFYTVSGVRLNTAVTTNLASLACPPSSAPSGSNDYFAGDIRVVIPGVGLPLGTGPVPGDGCPLGSQSNSSWASQPWTLTARRACLYNLRLGDDDMDLRTGQPNGTPWLNHTLHEFGHALGLGHEHARVDENASCVPTSHKEYQDFSQGLMTPYDKDSVMHYQFKPEETPFCEQIGSNYSHSGFTAYDRLALQILYPEDNRVAAFVGTTVLSVGETLELQSAWLARGANINVVAGNFNWQINGVTRSTGPTLTYDLPGAGEYTLTFSYDDLLGRPYSYSGVVRVLEPEAFAAQIVAPLTTQLPLLYPNYVYIPTIDATLQPAENVTVSLPSGLFSDTVVIDYQSLPHVATQGKADVGIFYELQATYLETGQPAQILPGKTYTVEATYADTAVSPHTNEADLGFYFWDPATNPGPPQWEREPGSTVDVNANQVTVTTNHFSVWAVLDKNKQYLPFVRR